MALFFTILLTMFIAEMGDKTQLLLVAMTSRFKLRDIIIGSAASILVLNGLAVGVGSIISKFVPLPHQNHRRAGLFLLRLVLPVRGR